MNSIDDIVLIYDLHPTVWAVRIGLSESPECEKSPTNRFDNFDPEFDFSAPEEISARQIYEDFFALAFLPDPARRGSPGVWDPSSHSLVDPVLTSTLLLRFLVPNFL